MSKTVLLFGYPAVHNAATGHSKEHYTACLDTCTALMRVADASDMPKDVSVSSRGLVTINGLKVLYDETLDSPHEMSLCTWCERIVHRHEVVDNAGRCEGCQDND